MGRKKEDFEFLGARTGFSETDLRENGADGDRYRKRSAETVCERGISSHLGLVDVRWSRLRVPPSASRTIESREQKSA